MSPEFRYRDVSSADPDDLPLLDLGKVLGELGTDGDGRTARLRCPKLKVSCPKRRFSGNVSAMLGGLPSPHRARTGIRAATRPRLFRTHLIRLGQHQGDGEAKHD